MLIRSDTYCECICVNENTQLFPSIGAKAFIVFVNRQRALAKFLVRSI